MSAGPCRAFVSRARNFLLTPPRQTAIQRPTSGDVLQGAAADCNSAGETHAWFDSRVAHHSPPPMTGLRISATGPPAAHQFDDKQDDPRPGAPGNDELCRWTTAPWRRSPLDENDQCCGGGASDLVHGDEGNDTVYGRVGAHRFVFNVFAPSERPWNGADKTVAEGLSFENVANAASLTHLGGALLDLAPWT